VYTEEEWNELDPDSHFGKVLRHEVEWLVGIDLNRSA